MRFKKQICALLAAFMLALPLISCGDGDKVAYPLPETEAKDTVQTEPPRETTDDGTFTHLIKSGRKYYRVIYPEGAGKELTDAVESLKNTVTVLTGQELVVRSDAEDAGDGREILIGRTDREDSKNAIGELKFLTFCVRVTDTNIVILGSNDRMTSLGVEWFIDNCIERNFNNIGEGYWRIASDTEYVSSEAPYLPENFITSEDMYVLEETGTVNVPCRAENGILRGSCTDGRYYYCAFEVNENGDCVIYKVDRESGEILQTGAEIPGLRAVDMTYDTSRSKIVAVDYSNGRSGVSVIDPESLTRIAEYDAGENISAIAYLKESNSFLALNEDKTALLSLSPVFKLKSREPFDATGGCGFDTDSSFIYLCVSDGDIRAVRIYSCDGDFVNEIALDEPVSAPRSLIAVGAELLLGYDTYFRGADIYEFFIKVGEKAA